MISSQDCNLLALPQEILNMIFDLAFGNFDAPDIVTADKWLGNEWFRIRRLRQVKLSKDPNDAQQMPDEMELKPRPFPYLKVNDFLVSKSFFLNAARAYMSLSPHGRGWNLDQMKRCKLFQRFANNVTCRYARDLYTIASFHKVRHLTIFTHPFIFRDFRVLPWSAPYGDDDVPIFEESQIMRQLRQIRGRLWTFDLVVAHKCYLCHPDPSDADPFPRNLDMICRYAEGIAVQSPTAQPDSETWIPPQDMDKLYPGSKVFNSMFN